MKRHDELVSVLNEIKINLKNNRILNILKHNNFDLESLSIAIEKYLNKKYAFEDDATYDKVYSKSKELLGYTNNSSFSSYIHNFINASNFIIEYSNSLVPLSVNIDNEKISREEFYTRYDKLVSLLNTFEQDCNLVLQTKVEKVDFKVYKNSNNAISVISGEEKTRLSFTKERLASIIYDNKEIDYHKSYTEVLIEKLLDNTIFNEIITDKTSVISTKNIKIEELENDNLKLLGQLQKLTERFNQREKDFESVGSILEKSSSLESEYNNAKEAVLKDLKLQVSYNYWEEQVKSYTYKYWGYFVGSMVSAIILLTFVFTFLQNNPLVINGTKSELSIVKINSDTNSTNKNIDSKDAFQLWEYGFLILVTTMGVWLIRILIKITLSNYHLSVDANERVIMIKTYLSLLKEGSGFEADDKKVMLDNIFRPTNFGIIKDETSVTIADILSSLKK